MTEAKLAGALAPVAYGRNIRIESSIMKVVAILVEKGGPRKTMLPVHLATAAALTGQGLGMGKRRGTQVSLNDTAEVWAKTRQISGRFSAAGGKVFNTAFERHGSPDRIPVASGRYKQA